MECDTHTSTKWPLYFPLFLATKPPSAANTARWNSIWIRFCNTHLHRALNRDAHFPNTKINSMPLVARSQSIRQRGIHTHTKNQRVCHSNCEIKCLNATPLCATTKAWHLFGLSWWIACSRCVSRRFLNFGSKIESNSVCVRGVMFRLNSDAKLDDSRPSDAGDEMAK